MIARLVLAGALLIGGCTSPEAPAPAIPPDTLAPAAPSDSGAFAPGAPALDTLDGDAPPNADAPAAETPFEGTTGLTEIGASAARPGGPVLVAVRTARQNGFDRLVFEFEGEARPAVRAGYESSHTECGSGDAVTVDGAATLVVSMRPARAHTEAGEATVDGRPAPPRLPSIRALRITCDFEADVTWAVGLAARRPYRVIPLAAPARIVVDVQH